MVSKVKINDRYYPTQSNILINTFYNKNINNQRSYWLQKMLKNLECWREDVNKEIAKQRSFLNTLLRYT